MPEGKQVQAMFSGIAGRYDFLNHCCPWGWTSTGGGAWPGPPAPAPGQRFLDVAAGTGDSSLALARRGAEVVSTDFTQAMLAPGPRQVPPAGARDRLIWASVGADAQRLPFRDRQLRRPHHLLRHPQRGGPAPGLRGIPAGAAGPAAGSPSWSSAGPRCAWLRAPLRHLQPGASCPGSAAGSAAIAWAYTYLPESIRAFPDQPALAAELEAAGFREVALDRPHRRHRGPAHRPETGRRWYHGGLRRTQELRVPNFSEDLSMHRGAAMSKPDPSITADLLSKLPAKKADPPKATPAREDRSTTGAPARRRQGQFPLRGEGCGGPGPHPHFQPGQVERSPSRWTRVTG